VVVIGLFALFAWRGYLICRRAPTVFLRLLAFGITTSIVLQTMVNIAVVGNLVPATGIPLPFFSSGGSSLLVSLVMVGLLLNVSRQTADGGMEVRNG
jgi:cell division protein FtsW